LRIFSYVQTIRSQKLSLYEHILIARQDITQGQADALADQFSAVITEMGGKITKREYWGLKTLAYRMKKNRKGHMLLLNLDAPHAAIQEMERRMRLHEDILRFLTVSVEAHEEGPSIMMRAPKDDRPARDDRFGGREDRGSRRPYRSREQQDTPVEAVISAE
jgi:small subunit ribosomal protein S6